MKELNIVKLPTGVRRVFNIAVGEQHMLMLCLDPKNPRACLYGLGVNLWGQLGIDPKTTAFVDALRPIYIESLGGEKGNYVIRQVECGSQHTVLLVDVKEDRREIIEESDAREET